MIKANVVVVVATLVFVSACSSEVRVTLLTEAPPTGHAELVEHGTPEAPDQHLSLSRAIAVGLECVETEYTFDDSYFGACREFSFTVDDDAVVTALGANLDGLAEPGAYAAPTGARTGLVLVGAGAGSTVLHVVAKGATLDLTIDVDETQDGTE
ncbi:MAG: hypothetical protein Q8O67_08990 [Deltaproteobacteria bacterium]|nr:hypothetical protein [Deltaproteobacteria bacterium]